ncbi:MAG: hypothetical protein U0599_03845 [Vicinamibacteria bacterium]
MPAKPCGSLETILLEVSSVRLTPAESGILFKSLDQLATPMGAGEHVLARDVVAQPLLGILHKNRVKRSLFRLMEVEVEIQQYLQQRLGHDSPQIHVPEDLGALADYGPVRAFEEKDVEGGARPLHPGQASRHPDPLRHRRRFSREEVTTRRGTSASTR